MNDNEADGAAGPPGSGGSPTSRQRRHLSARSASAGHSRARWERESRTPDHTRHQSRRGRHRRRRRRAGVVAIRGDGAAVPESERTAAAGCKASRMGFADTRGEPVVIHSPNES